MNPIDPLAARVEHQLKIGEPLIGCRFDPSGRFLFVSTQDDTIRRHDFTTDRAIKLVGHKSWVRAMACVPQGDEKADPRPFLLVTGDYHGKLIWWQGDATEPKPIRTMEAHDGWIRAVAVSPDGKTLASCGNDNAVKLWDAVDGKPIRTLTGHESHVYNVAFHPDGNRLASCDLMGVVKDWNLATGDSDRDLDAKELTKYDTTFKAQIGGARAMRFTADGTQLACSGITDVTNAFAGVGNPVVVMFDWKSGKPKVLKPKEKFQGTAWGFAFHPEGFSIIAAGGSGGRVWFAKPNETTTFKMLNIPGNATARDLDLSPDGERFALAGSNGIAFVYTFTPAPAKPEPAGKK